MKKLFYYSVIALAAFAASNKINAQNANTSLSNLVAPTKINVGLLPDKDKTRSLGSATKGWKNLYLDSAVYLAGAKFLAAPGGNKLNTAVGFNTLSFDTSGGENTAIGYFALHSNSSGFNNTATGYAALNVNTTGAQNTAIGVYALVNNTTSNSNTATGYSALYKNTGIENTANGV